MAFSCAATVRSGHGSGFEFDHHLREGQPGDSDERTDAAAAGLGQPPDEGVVVLEDLLHVGDRDVQAHDVGKREARRCQECPPPRVWRRSRCSSQCRSQRLEHSSCGKRFLAALGSGSQYGSRLAACNGAWTRSGAFG